MNIPTLIYASVLCLLLNAVVVIWIKLRERRPKPPPFQPPERPIAGPVSGPVSGIALKVGLRQAEAELIMKLNGMMTSGRDRRP